MAEVEDISQAEADKLSPADPSNMSIKEMKALLRNKSVATDHVIEKSMLQQLVRENASISDVEDFMKRQARQTRSVPSSCSSSSSSPSTSSSELSSELRAFKQSLAQQAKMAREDISNFRRIAPSPIRELSDQQIYSVAANWEACTKDDNKLKAAFAHFQQQQASGSSNNAMPKSKAEAVDSFFKLSDAAIESFINMVKANPDYLKQQLRAQGILSQGNESQMNMFINYIQQSDTQTLKKIPKTIQKLKPIWEGYKWVDRITGGYGYIVALIFFLLFCYFCWLYLAGPVWWAISYIPKTILR